MKVVLFFFLFQFCFYSNEKNDLREIESALDLYFSSWSKANMIEYKNLFHDSAMIQFDSGFEIKTEFLEEFIVGQIYAHKTSLSKMTEIPINKKIQIESGKAQAIVRWKLTSENREQMGYDYFTFVKIKNKWKIVHLIFHNDK